MDSPLIASAFLDLDDDISISSDFDFMCSSPQIFLMKMENDDSNRKHAHSPVTPGNALGQISRENDDGNARIFPQDVYITPSTVAGSTITPASGTRPEIPLDFFLEATPPLAPAVTNRHNSNPSLPTVHTALHQKRTRRPLFHELGSGSQVRIRKGKGKASVVKHTSEKRRSGPCTYTKGNKGVRLAGRYDRESGDGSPKNRQRGKGRGKCDDRAGSSRAYMAEYSSGVNEEPNSVGIETNSGGAAQEHEPLSSAWDSAVRDITGNLESHVDMNTAEEEHVGALRQDEELGLDRVPIDGLQSDEVGDFEYSGMLPHLFAVPNAQTDLLLSQQVQHYGNMFDAIHPEHVPGLELPSVDIDMHEHEHEQEQEPHHISIQQDGEVVFETLLEELLEENTNPELEDDGNEVQSGGAPNLNSPLEDLPVDTAQAMEDLMNQRLLFMYDHDNDALPTGRVISMYDGTKEKVARSVSQLRVTLRPNEENHHNEAHVKNHYDLEAPFASRCEHLLLPTRICKAIALEKILEAFGQHGN